MSSNGKNLKWVGTRPVRPDGVDKVTGRARFGADFSLPNMLVGQVLRSPHAHARIRSIDTSKAEALPGVKAVLTSADLPELPGGFEPAGEAMTCHEPGTSKNSTDRAKARPSALSAVFHIRKSARTPVRAMGKRRTVLVRPPIPMKGIASQEYSAFCPLPQDTKCTGQEKPCRSIPKWSNDQAS